MSPSEYTAAAAAAAHCSTAFDAADVVVIRWCLLLCLSSHMDIMFYSSQAKCQVMVVISRPSVKLLLEVD